MAPFTFSHTTAGLLALVIGCLFGFVLERSGFGNARNLAAQFYLRDMRVLKVMFTGIVTAMVLLFGASALGLADFGRVWVPPTYFWPGVVGGLMLGVGFIVGGYCPGTSLVSMATLKVDGLLFVFGVLFGAFVFGVTAPFSAVWGFWHHAGAVGRLTIADWLGVDAGLVVLAVVAMAVGVFWVVEQVERLLAPDRMAPVRSPRAKRWRRTAVGVGLLLATTTALVGQPTVERRVGWQDEQLSQRLRDREIHIDPAEVLGLMHDRSVRLVLVDVRTESDYNAFHLLDAEHVPWQELDITWGARLPSEAVVVVMSNDEWAADEAWKRLAVQPGINAYVLAGGINRWLDLYTERRADVPDSDVRPQGNDTCRHPFASALGERHATARPKLDETPDRSFTAKVKRQTPQRTASGGCG